jgi:hypothetical protein
MSARILAFLSLSVGAGCSGPIALSRIELRYNVKGDHYAQRGEGPAAARMYWEAQNARVEGRQRAATRSWLWSDVTLGTGP